MNAASGRRPRVLVVDDEPLLRDSMCDLFEEEGYETFAAANGRDAVHALTRTAAPDAIVLDLDMPVMDGVQFHNWLKGASSDLSQVPVLLVSANARITEVARALQVEAYLVKPVLPLPLLRALGDLVARRVREPDDAVGGIA